MSDKQIGQMISPLPHQEQQALAKSMTVIEQSLSAKAAVQAKPDIHIRHDLRARGYRHLDSTARLGLC